MSNKKNTKPGRDAMAGQALLAMQDTCPPELYKIIEREGSIAAAGRATGLAKYTIAQVGKGVWKLSRKMRDKIDAYLEHGPRAARTTTEKKPMTEAKPEPVTIPPWDKKMVTHKYANKAGKKTTLKLPALMAELFTRHDNVKNSVGRALGFSGYSGVETSLADGKYESKLHARAYCAVNGLPLPNGKSNSEDDARDGWTLGLAICLVGMNEFEHVEEIAEIMGGALVFKMTAGNAGWWAIYRISHREKLEKFKRLASRDAKKIVCP